MEKEQETAGRVRSFLEGYASIKGLDPEMVHSVRVFKEDEPRTLTVSDLTALVEHVEWAFDPERPELKIRDSHFGPWLDFGASDAIVVGTDEYGIMPRILLLAHQCYVSKVVWLQQQYAGSHGIWVLEMGRATWWLYRYDEEPLKSALIAHRKDAY